MDGLGRQMAKGATWMVAFKFVERSLGLISTIILARLLLREDFGVVALAMALIGLIELIGLFSFDVVLIQKQDADRPEYDTAWTFTVIIKTVTAVGVMAIAYPYASVYEEPRLVPVILLLALAVFVQGFENVGVVAFRKQMQFHREFAYLLGKKLAAFCVTVPLAIVFRNYWALVIGMLTGRTAGVVLSYVVQSYRPRFSLAARSELFGFSKWLLINNYINFFNNRAAHFIIGKISGADALGLYTVTYQISNMPTTELAFPINRAVFPGYAKASRDSETLRRSFLDVVGMLVFFALPAGAGIAILAEPIVHVFLGGGQWLPGIPVIQILALFGVISAVQTNNGYVFLAAGKPRIVTILAGAYLVLMAGLVSVLTYRMGVVGAAWGFLGAAIVMLPVNYVLLFRELDLAARRFLGVVWRPLAGTVLMYGAIAAFARVLGPAESGPGWVIRLIGGLVIGVGVYFAITLGAWRAAGSPRGAESALLDEVRRRIRRTRGPAPVG